MIESRRPTKRFHPGVYVKDALEALNMSSKEFSIRTGISERTLSDLINEKGSVTFDIATKLSEFFGNSVNSWTNLQNDYDIYMLENKQKEELEEDYNLLKPLKNYLIENGFIEVNDDKEKVVSKIRTTLSVNRLSALSIKEPLVSFKEQRIEPEKKNYFAQNFWLAYALTESRKIEVMPYKKENVINEIKYLKTLMDKSPKTFYPLLTDSLRKCGISYVLVPYLKTSYIYGATKWFSNDNVMLAMSNRSERADIFWFTLFHELSHVLEEHKRYCLFQSEKVEDKNADEIASNILIPKKEWSMFLDSTTYFSDSVIKNFAKRVGVPPFVVVGRLAKEKKIDYSASVFRQNMVAYKNEDFARL